MSTLAPELKRLTPLRKAVMAAIVDSGEDVGRVEQQFYHWGARGLKKLERETFLSSKKKVLLTVNKSTRSATLPANFDYETFVAVLDDYGKKIPLKLNNSLVDVKAIEDIPCEDKCPKCNQDKAICEEITTTETTSVVDVNGQSAELTVIKKLYPDGSYYLETKTPVWDYDQETVVYHTTKEKITELDLKPCGCIDETPENIEKIRTCCPETWACWFAECGDCCSDYGGYKIFEETGMIYFDNPKKFSKVYIEYEGFLPRINGQYYIPTISLETITEWINYKRIQHKRNVSATDKQMQFDRYRTERADMEHVMGRITLSQILKWVESVPKFDLECDRVCDIVSGSSNTITSFSAVSTSASMESGTPPNNNVVCCPGSGTRGLQSFQIAVIAGMGPNTPIPDVNYYTLEVLKNALNLNLIIVNNQNENTKSQQMTFDPVTGTIYRWQGDNLTPNLWVAGDVLIANFDKLI